MDMSISSAPGYEKAAHQSAMYDMKSSIEHQQIAHQQRQMPTMEGYDDPAMAGQGHQLGMGMPAAASWAAETTAAATTAAASAIALERVLE